MYLAQRIHLLEPQRSREEVDHMKCTLKQAIRGVPYTFFVKRDLIFLETDLEIKTSA